MIKKITIALIYSLTLSVLAFAQKNSAFSPEVERVLQKAGSNRLELERLLNHYKPRGGQAYKGKNVSDEIKELKWKAACKQVSNMDIHYSETYYWADSLGNKVPFAEMDYPSYSESKKAFALLTEKLKLHPVKVIKYDMMQIKADFLIRNLDMAFAAWQSPRSKHLTFDEFFEYLLPYRSLSENLENWRQVYADTFKVVMKNADTRNVIENVNQLNIAMGGYFSNTFSYEPRSCPVNFLSPLQLLFRKESHCEDFSNFTCLAFRSQGIACRVDMVAYHATSTGRHYLNATIDEQHNTLSFETSKRVESFKTNREPAKVLTFTYSRQENVPSTWVDESEIPDNFLRKKNFVDVTSNYWKTANVQFNLQKTYDKKLAYISVLNGLQWCPAYWAKITDSKQVLFKEMCVGVVYLAVLYINGRLMPVAYPKILFQSGDELELVPDLQKRRSITMNEEEKYLKYRPGKKYKLFYWNNKWELIDQKIAGSEAQITFENVPANALLLMIPEYSERKERPFTISNDGVRMWW